MVRGLCNPWSQAAAIPLHQTTTSQYAIYTALLNQAIIHNQRVTVSTSAILSRRLPYIVAFFVASRDASKAE